MAVDTVAVRELELDLDAFEGPFDLLLSLVLREELPLAELDLAQIVVAFVERLAEYRRAKEAAVWLAERLAAPRYFRLGPAPLAPKPPEPQFASQDPEKLANVLRLLAVPPPELSTAHMALRFPPVAQFLERWRSLLSRRSLLDFDHEVAGFSRVEVAVAFLALLELRKAGEIAMSQAAPFAPIRISRAASERSLTWTAHSG
jgi:segregation and condensation protein A